MSESRECIIEVYIDHQWIIVIIYLKYVHSTCNVFLDIVDQLSFGRPTFGGMSQRRFQLISVLSCRHFEDVVFSSIFVVFIVLSFNLGNGSIPQFGLLFHRLRLQCSYDQTWGLSFNFSIKYHSIHFWSLCITIKMNVL